MSVGRAVIGPAGPADLGRVAEIFAHYVTHTVVTFETDPPTVADWQAVAAGHPEWFTADHVHLQPPGARALASLILLAATS